MRLSLCVALLALAGACTPADPIARTQGQWQVCAGAAAPRERLHACSEVIAAESATPEQRAAALVERGAQRAELGQHLRAVADFGRALRIEPRLVRAYLARGQVHHDRGAYESALADYDAALAIEPDLDSALIGREAALRDRAETLARGLGSVAVELETLTARIAAN